MSRPKKPAAAPAPKRPRKMIEISAEHWETARVIGETEHRTVVAQVAQLIDEALLARSVRR